MNIVVGGRGQSSREYCALSGPHCGRALGRKRVQVLPAVTRRTIRQVSHSPPSGS